MSARPTSLITVLLLTSCAASARRAPEAPAAPARASGRAVTAQAEEPKAGAAGDAAALAAANNPLANMKALNFQNYYVPELSETDELANQFWIRYAQPLSFAGGKWLMRASLPLSTLPTGPNQSQSGLGDANVFASYLIDPDNPETSKGVGPLLGIPTATDDALGTDQWSAGLAAVYFDASSPKLQYGGLVTWQHKFAGSDRVDPVNLLAVQPFGILQLGGGNYVRSTGIWAFDLESGNYSVPFGLGLGKVVKLERTVLNFFIEPQVTVLHDGPGQPLFQVFFGLNTQFLGG